MLTERQDRIIGLMAYGYTDKEIAVELGLSYAGVRYHIDRALRKLGAKSRAELVHVRRLVISLPTGKARRRRKVQI